MKNSFRIIFGAVILFLLVYFLRNLNFSEIFIAIGKINPVYFILSFAIFSLANLIFIARGMISLRKIVKPHFWFFSEAAMAGFFGNLITPGSQAAGEPLRAYYLAKKYKKPKTKMFGAVLADRIIHGAVSLFFVIASLIFIIDYVPVTKELKIIIQVILLFIFAFIAVLVLLRIRKKKFNLRDFLEKIGILTRIKNIKIFKNIEKHLGNFTSSFKKTIEDKKTLFFGIIFSIAHWFLIYLSSYFIFLALGIKVSFLVVIVVVCLGSIIGEFSPTPGGVGFTEGSLIFFYSLLGIGLYNALIVTILSRAMGYFYALIVGGLSLLHLEKTLGSQ